MEITVATTIATIIIVIMAGSIGLAFVRKH